MPAQRLACWQHVAHDIVLCCLWTHPRSENIFNPFCGIVEMEHRSIFEYWWAVCLWGHNITGSCYVIAYCMPKNGWGAVQEMREVKIYDLKQGFGSYEWLEEDLNRKRCLLYFVGRLQDVYCYNIQKWKGGEKNLYVVSGWVWIKM